MENGKKIELKKKIKIHNVMDKELWNFIIRHIHEKSFRKTKNSFLQFLFIPPLFNLFLSSRLSRTNRILKPYLSIGCFLTFFVRCNNIINDDIVENAFIYEDLSKIIQKSCKIDIYNYK